MQPVHLLQKYRITAEEVWRTAKHGYGRILGGAEIEEAVGAPRTPLRIFRVCERTLKDAREELVAERPQAKMTDSTGPLEGKGALDIVDKHLQGLVLDEIGAEEETLGAVDVVCVASKGPRVQRAVVPVPLDELADTRNVSDTRVDDAWKGVVARRVLLDGDPVAWVLHLGQSQLEICVQRVHETVREVPYQWCRGLAHVEVSADIFEDLLQDEAANIPQDCTCESFDLCHGGHQGEVDGADPIRLAEVLATGFSLKEEGLGLVVDQLRLVVCEVDEVFQAMLSGGGGGGI